jgi:hypothetical protein
MTTGPDQPNYKAMAELRYQIRRFLRFSENAARQVGIEPQQHQLLLAVRGLPDNVKPTIGVLAEECSYNTTALWNSSTDWSKGLFVSTALYRRQATSLSKTNSRW